MVKCSCGKVIEKVPDWMQTVKVEFVCNKCPQRKVQNIVFAPFDAKVAETKILEPENLEPTQEEDEIVD